MALGGGNFVSQNKKLPGSYINFISRNASSATVSDRGVAAIGLSLDWGADNDVFKVTASDFQKNSLKLFGYESTHEKLKGLRDLFINAHTVYCYKLNSSTSGKATNTFATALHTGARGNDLKIVIAANADDSGKWDVKTLLGTVKVDEQTVAAAVDLVDNAFVTFKKDATLAATAATALTGGVSATETVAGHQAFLDKVEAHSFNAIGAVSDEREEGATAINALYAAFVKRMRDEMGVKFQAVLFRCTANHEGVVNLDNITTDADWSAASLVYWVTGLVAGTAVNKSAMNTVYDGEFTVDVDYSQAALEANIDAGKYTLHRVGQDVRVLMDINSLTDNSADKGEIFRENQTIRVIDAIANDIATLFNTKYLGKIPNNAAGRVSLWTDIVKHHKELERISAIENFDESQVTVEAGDTKRAVVVNDVITIVNAMGQLYMTCIVQ